MIREVCRSRPAASPRLRLGAALAAATVAALLAGANPAAATSFRTYGFGARAISLGGAMTAAVDDYTATFYNPAGLVIATEKQFSIGAQFLDIDVSAKNSAPVPPGAVRDSDPFRMEDSLGAYGGMRFLIPFADALAGRVGFGLSFYTGLPDVLAVDVPFAFTPQYVLANDQTQVIITEPGIGVRVMDGLRVGLAADVFADVGGNLEIPTGVRGADGVDEARTVIDQEVQPVVRGTAGVQLDGALLAEALEPWALGITWRDSFSIPLQIPVTVLLGPIPLNIDLTSELLWTPMQTALGVAYRTHDLLVAADLSWNQWSKFKAPTLELALDVTIPVVPIDLKDAINASPRTHDTFTPRLGVEWLAYEDDVTGVRLRGGYAFDPTPFGAQAGASNFLDGDRHLVGAGVGLALREPPLVADLGGRLSIDLGVQLGIQEQRTLVKDRLNPLFAEDGNPLAFPPLDTPDGRPLADPAYPSIRGEATTLLVMLTVTTAFDPEGLAP